MASGCNIFYIMIYDYPDFLIGWFLESVLDKGFDKCLCKNGRLYP